MAEGSKVGSIYYDLNLDDKKFHEGRQRVQAGASEMGMSFSKMTGAVALGSAISNMASTAWSGFKDVLGFVAKAGMDNERAQAQLGAAIQSTGGKAGVSAKMANEYAEALEKSTPISKDAALTAENMLLTFTSIGKDVFPQATQAVADMATRMNGGLTPSAEQLSHTAIQVGKALQDPIKGITALHKVGVNFTEQQKEQIKHFMDINDQAGAQRIILKELSTEFGGSAAASAETFSGALQMIKNNLTLVAEKVWDSLSPTIASLEGQLSVFVSSDKFQHWVKTTADALAKDLPIAIDFIVHSVIPLLVQTWKTIEPAVKLALEILIKTFEFIAHHKQLMLDLATVVLAAVAAWKTVSTVISAIEGVKKAYAALRLLMLTDPIILIITAVIAIIILLVLHWKEISKAAGAAWKAVSKEAEKVWHDVSKFFTNLWHDLTHIVGEIVKGVVKFFTELPGNILKGLAALPKLLLALLEGLAFLWGLELGLIYKLVTKWIPDIAAAFLRELLALPGQVWNIMVAVWNFMTRALTQAWHSATTIALQIVHGVISFIAQLPGEIWNWLMHTASRMSEGANHMKSNFMNNLNHIPGEVVNMLKSILSHITDWAGKLAGAIGGVASGMWDAFKKGIGKASPSFFERAFTDISAASQQTVQDMKEHVGQLDGLASQASRTGLVNTRMGNLAGSSIAQSQPVYNFTLNLDGIMAKSKTDLRFIAKDLVGALNEELRAKGQPQIPMGLQVTPSAGTTFGVTP